MARLILSQDEFNDYLRGLHKEECQYMQKKILNLCSEGDFKCPYRGTERFDSMHGLKECKREKMMKFERMFTPVKKVNPFMLHKD